MELKFRQESELRSRKLTFQFFTQNAICSPGAIICRPFAFIPTFFSDVDALIFMKLVGKVVRNPISAAENVSWSELKVFSFKIRRM